MVGFAAIVLSTCVALLVACCCALHDPVRADLPAPCRFYTSAHSFWFLHNTGFVIDF